MPAEGILFRIADVRRPGRADRPRRLQPTPPIDLADRLFFPSRSIPEPSRRIIVVAESCFPLFLIDPADVGEAILRGSLDDNLTEL